MNDAERDAWLREALRHAPDADAAPPSMVSEAILARARATAAQPAVPAAARRPANAGAAAALLAFWAWLARPPVAAGFASVMAATLVGLMWWDRPMDETLAPPTPALERAQAPRAAEPSAPTEKRLPAPATPDQARNAAPSRSASPSTSPPAPSALPSKPTSRIPAGGDAPAPFPSNEAARGAGAPTPPLADAKKASAAPLQRSAASPPPAVATPAAEAERMPTPLASGRVAADEARRVAPSSGESNSDVAIAKSAPAARVESKLAADAVREPAAIAGAAPAPATPALRQRAPADAREKQAEAFGAAAAPGRADANAPRREAPAELVAAPLAPLLAALNRDAARWTRQAAGGTAPVEPAWRDWLADLESAGGGRWRTSADAIAPLAAATAKDAGATVRLYRDGRLAATVRLEGSSARIELQGDTGPERWQAELAPATAQRLRATLARLAP